MLEVAMQFHRSDKPGATAQPASSDSSASSPLIEQKSILLVEDEYLVALDLSLQILEDGGRVSGPAYSTSDALEFLNGSPSLAGAILDVNIDGEMAFAVADTLADLGVPFIFYTGYGRIDWPERFRDVPRVSKPANWIYLKQALIVARGERRRARHDFRDHAMEALPHLRRKARQLTGARDRADQLVERTLERAIREVERNAEYISVENWLMDLLEETSHDFGHRYVH
jgi:hypothetical protein